ncbi:MAG: hypothetical protein AAF386_02895 [Pseudomonadota bacterium]
MGHMTSEIAKEIEVAVRGRLSNWTRNGLHFAQLDIPYLLNSVVAQKLIDDPVSAPDPGSTVDDAALVAYFSELDIIANPCLQGTNVVTLNSQQLTHSFRTFLDRARPVNRALSAAEQVELTTLNGALYQDTTADIPEKTDGFSRYRRLKMAVLELAVALNEAQNEHGPEDPAVARVQFQLDMAETDLATMGNAQYYEAVQSRIEELTQGLDVRWSQARHAYDAGQILDANSNRRFAVTAVQKVPSSHWQTLKIFPKSPQPGEFLGLDEIIQSIEADLFVVPISRSAWFDEPLLSSGAWEWAIPGVNMQISDGNGFGDLANIPQSMVLLKNVQIKAKVPKASFDDATKKMSTMPKLGRMIVPFQIDRIDGVALKANASHQVQQKSLAQVRQRPAGTTMKERRQQMLRVTGKDLQVAKASLGAIRLNRPAVAMPKARIARPMTQAVLDRAVSAKAARPVARQAKLGAMRRILTQLRPARAHTVAKPARVTATVTGLGQPTGAIVRFQPAKGGKATTAKVTNGKAIVPLRPGPYDVHIDGLPGDLMVAPKSIEVTGKPLQFEVAAVSKWTDLEVSAFADSADNGAVVFGYLVKQMPQLPRPAD